MFSYNYHFRRMRRPRRQVIIRAAQEAVFPLADVGSELAVVFTRDKSKTAHLGYKGANGQLVVPANTPVLAVRDGTITSVTHLDEGPCIALDHYNGFMTMYAGLTSTRFDVGRRTPVVRGQILGYIGAPDGAPEGAPARPLLFSFYSSHTRDVPGFPRVVDPMVVLPYWRHLRLEKRSPLRVGDCDVVAD